MNDQTQTRLMLDRAARLAFRGFGRVEPNPAVGCVITDASGAVIGLGHHARFGGPHAEAEALRNCRERGHDPRGATAYVTLEPCNAPGKQPACSEALIAAGIARVVCARRDPNPLKSGGAERLRSAGVQVDFTEVSRNATRLADPFIKRLTSGLPWVICKWAQTLDGKVATRTGQSQWISNERSRRWVHLTRARVDGVLTGIGTVRADDPLLTARNVPIRRQATRFVIDPAGELSPASKLLTLPGPKLVQIVAEGAGTGSSPATSGGRSGGAVRLVVPTGALGIDLRVTLQAIARDHGVSTLLCECGPGFTSELFRAGLVDEAHIYVAPMFLGDEQARPALRGFTAEALADVPRWQLVLSRRVGDDQMLVYRRPL